MTAEQKKAMIAASFQKHFYQYGFKKTSVDDVAHDLNMSKKTIYQLFPSKEAIYTYLLDTVAAQYRERIGQRLAALPGGEAKIASLVRLFLEETRRWLAPTEDFEKQFRYELARAAFERAFVQALETLAAGGQDEPDAGRAALRARLALGMAKTGLELMHAGEDLSVIEEVVAAALKLMR